MFRDRASAASTPARLALSLQRPEVTMAPTRSDIKELLETWSAAIRTKDTERLMSLYAPGIVYFDVTPPLQHKGRDAVRENFIRWFDRFSGDIDIQIHDLHISMSGSLATALMLHRTSGVHKNGQRVDYWVRATVSCQRLDGQWRITHEHVSLPLESGLVNPEFLESGRGA
jgi:uncharacterized protein (TIGR02246 family)